VTEQWRPIPGYGGAYEVSDMGRVRSLPRQVAGKIGKDGENSTRTVQGRILSPRVRADGTLAVNLWIKNKYRQQPVKRLVLEAFVRRQPMGYDAKNMDDDPANNRLSNLRWEPVGGLALLRQRLGR
jgi:hypothetical protein